MNDQGYVDLLAANVRAILDDPNPGPNVFASAAIAGEHLRQGIASAEQPSPEAVEALRRYDDWVRRWPGPFPESLLQLLEQSLRELRQLAEAERDRPSSFEDGERILLDIDATLAVAAALWRAGRMEESAVRGLATRAATVVGEVAPYLRRWWEWADESWERFIGDPDLPFLHDWWSRLGRFAPARVHLEAAVFRAARRERLRRWAIDRYVGSPVIRTQTRPHDPGKVAAATISGPGSREPLPALSARRVGSEDHLQIPLWWLADIKGGSSGTSLAVYLGLPARAAGAFHFRPRSIALRGGALARLSPVDVRGGEARVCVTVQYPRRRAGRTVIAWIGDRSYPLEPLPGARTFEIELPKSVLSKGPFALAEGNRCLWRPRGGKKNYGPRKKRRSVSPSRSEG